MLWLFLAHAETNDFYLSFSHFYFILELFIILIFFFKFFQGKE